MSREDDQYLLQVSNNGRLPAEGLDVHNAKTLGLRLVNQLTWQLQGDLSIESYQDLVSFRIAFPAIE